MARRSRPITLIALTFLAWAAANLAAQPSGGWADNPGPSDATSLFANFIGDMPRATAAVRDALRENDGWVVMPLLGGPHGARPDCSIPTRKDPPACEATT